MTTDETIDYGRLRKDAGLSLAQLGKRTGFSKSHVSNVELGNSHGSAAYNKAFLAAVNPNGEQAEDIPIRIASLSRARRIAARKLTQFTEEASDLQKALGSIRSLQSLARDLIEQCEEIAPSNGPLPSQSFNPTTASPEQIEEVAQYIGAALVELFLEFNYQLLTQEQLDAHLDKYVKHVTREVRRAGARKGRTV